MPTGADLATAAHTLVGIPYLWNGKDRAGLDCSGAIFEACRLVGVEFVHGSSAQIAACDPMDVDLAWGTPGALLWREGHDALVYAPDVSVEAVVPAVTLLGRSDTYDGGLIRFTHAGLIPGVDYQEAGVALPKITSPYGPRRIVVGGKLRTYPHRGVDLRSPKGGEVVSLFSGTVLRTASRVPNAPIGRTDSAGNQALASTVSGGGTVIKRDDGGYYLEVHMDPSVQVGDRVRALETVLGRTDLSGQITGAHRHVELWREFDPDSHYDPTDALRAAAAGPRGGTPTTPEEDDMTPAQEAKLDRALVLLEQLDGALATGSSKVGIGQAVAALPAAVRDAVLGAWLGKGARRATVAQHIAATAVDADQAVEILTREDPS